MDTKYKFQIVELIVSTCSMICALKLFAKDSSRPNTYLKIKRSLMPSK